MPISLNSDQGKCGNKVTRYRSVKVNRMAKWRRLLGSATEPNERLSMELSGTGIKPAVQILTDEVKSKRPILVFLAETKANASKVKGIQKKLETDARYYGSK